jgi:hypothetical protein
MKETKLKLVSFPSPCCAVKSVTVVLLLLAAIGPLLLLLLLLLLLYKPHKIVTGTSSFFAKLSR